MELLFFIFCIIVVAFLFMMLATEFSFEYFISGGFIGILLWMILTFTSLIFIPVDYESKITDYELYPIYENGELSDSYYRLVDNGRIKVDIGETLIITPKIKYGSEYKLQKVEYTWDDGKFPHNIFLTGDKSDDYILYLKESE